MFKVGDKVVCVNDQRTLYLRLGNHHIVVASYLSDGVPVVILEDDGPVYDAVRFVLYEEKLNTVDEPVAELKTGMTLPTDSKTRKNYPLLAGCVRYFPAALAGVALISKKGNDKHNPGEELHHARSKSMDHGDCILRHLIDTQDLLADMDRSGKVDKERILDEVSQLAWRVLAYSQEIHEKLGAPLAPGAKS